MQLLVSRVHWMQRLDSRSRTLQDSASAINRFESLVREPSLVVRSAARRQARQPPTTKLSASNPAAVSSTADPHQSVPCVDLESRSPSAQKNPLEPTREFSNPASSTIRFASTVACSLFHRAIQSGLDPNAIRQCHGPRTPLPHREATTVRVVCVERRVVSCNFMIARRVIRLAECDPRCSRDGQFPGHWLTPRPPHHCAATRERRLAGDSACRTSPHLDFETALS